MKTLRFIKIVPNKVTITSWDNRFDDDLTAKRLKQQRKRLKKK